MSDHIFLLEPKLWLGEGVIQLNMVEEELGFVTRWNVSNPGPEGEIESFQEIQIKGINDIMNNRFLITGLGNGKFSMSLENDAIGKVQVAVENYPDLKSSQNFLQLQASLNEVEEQISAGRRAYNAIVTQYNNAVEMFPSNIMAKLMGFKRRGVFVINEQERQNVDVKNLFKQ